MKNSNLEVICHELYETPKDRGEEDFLKFVERNLNQFKNKLDDFEGKVAQKVNDCKDPITQLCDKIVHCLKYYYEGRTYEAYRVFSEGLNFVLNNNSTVFSPADYHNYNSQLNRLYRARVSKDILSKRTEMFHPPAYLRHMLSDQRYSIRGLPCIYLANSSYVCWEELGRPDIREFWVSRFELDRKVLPILYLNPTSRYLTGAYKFAQRSNMIPASMLENLIPQFLLKWPLQMVTSVKVAKQYVNANFKPEYIIPQFLMEWVRNNKKFRGICYPTTKNTIADNFIAGDMVNYAIPAGEIRGEGFCKYMSEHLRMTSPVSVKLMEMLQIKTDISNLEKAMKPNAGEDFDDFPGDFDLTTSSDIRQPYANTLFGTLEAYLNSLPSKLLIE